MGRLVQPSSAARAHRQHPACRSRRSILCCRKQPRYGSVTHKPMPPADPARFIFTDINMPGPIDGLELADIVSTRFPRVKVIVTSGKQWLEPKELPDDSLFLPKPYRPTQLARLVGQQAGRLA
ncbi:response regulator [Sphingomonas sp. ABOLD]|nr:response regulator [Sphingomonas sp. ABOLD]